MTDDERVALLKSEFPRIDRPFVVKLRNTADYGGIFCRRAREILRGKRPTKNYWYLSARVKNAYADKAQVEEWLEICGYNEKQAWVNQCLKRLQAEAAARTKGKAALNAGTSRAAERKITTK